MSSDCIFCRIVSRDAEAEIHYEDDDILVFTDLYPKAPVHLLIIPKRHIDSLAHLEPGDTALMGRCVQVSRLLGEQVGYAARGYRLSCNCGPEGGQIVNHLHFHFLAGRRK